LLAAPELAFCTTVARSDVTKEMIMVRLVMMVTMMGAGLVASAALAAEAPKQTIDFANSVASATAFEIQSSQLAQKNAKSAELRAFADQMIADHTKAAAEFKTALQEAGITPPNDSMGVMDLAKYEKLHLTTANSFDGAYAKAQLDAHEKAVALFRDYAQTGQTQALKEFAQKTLPTLEHHLEMIKGLNQKIAPAG
jgi:putative membrane protein